MVSSSVFSETEQYKFNTRFSDGCYHHTIPSETGTRSEIWSRVKLLARGAFGTVWLESEEKGQLRAVKRIAKTNNLMHLRELLTLTKLKMYSKHFVQFLGWFENDDDMYFAMEYIKHGDLSKLIHKSSMPESDVKSITRQLLEGLKVMHENNFCHRDLKPENILVVSLSPIIVKICDFGVSKRLLEGTDFRTTVGTGGYIAPEVWGFIDSDTSVYTCAIDIWSLGCLIYALLTKETPFPDVRKLIDYVEGRMAFPETKLLERGASSDVINFIISLMMSEPEARLTAKAALKDLWLTEESVPTGLKKTNLSNGRTTKKATHRCTDLHCAARHGSLSSMRLFVEKGVDLGMRNKPGRTPLHSAAAAGHCGIVRYLLKEGANIMATGRYGETPLHCAAAAGYTEVVRTLLEGGADIMARQKDGHTPLHSAASSGHSTVVDLLLEEGADILATNNYGRTALGEATCLGRKTIAKSLLRKEKHISSGGRDIDKVICRRNISAAGRSSTDNPVGERAKHLGKAYRNKWLHGVEGWNPWRAILVYKYDSSSIFGTGLTAILSVVESCLRRKEVGYCRRFDQGNHHRSIPLPII